ncbi:transferase [Streptomyces sp. NPDC059479]|uniref:transferase n=1 Tax=Streptomyces sp. NPDC059479 TaxID=3346848 RepID=UPI0036943B2E
MRANGRRASPAGCTADCIADSAGGITFDITGAARPDAVLVLRLRDGAAEVRLPLTWAGESRLRAVLPSTVELAEGHWDVFTGAPGEQPVRPGVRDVRALVDRIPGAGRVAARIPYATADGRLAVRSWVRAPHAEAGTVRCEPGATTVEGMLYGASLGEGAEAEARLRGTDRSHRVAVTGRGGSFAFTLPYGPLAARPVVGRQWWDLWLVPARNAAGIRISRILDDIWDKRTAYVCAGHGTDGWLAAPCYTGDNDFSVRLDPAPVSAATR